MPALQRGAAWAEERLSGALRQSVPQNGRVHLHMIDRKTGGILFREYCFGEENSLSRLTEFWGKLGEFCEKLGEFALAHK